LESHSPASPSTARRPHLHVRPAALPQTPTIGTIRNVLHRLDRACPGCNHEQRAPPPDRAWSPARPAPGQAQAHKLPMKVFPEPFRSIFLLTAPVFSPRRLTLFLGCDYMQAHKIG